MVKPSRPPANAFVRVMRKVYNPLGFARGYNFTLFSIFFTGLMAFSLYSMPLLDYSRQLCPPDDETPSGECFYQRFGLGKIGIIMHLAGILPASVLACWQFLPVIRHKVLILHRINGYVVLALSAVGAIGGLLVTRHAFGGGLEIQAASGVVFIAFTVSSVLAYINIKRLQIEQHRAWMLRAWFYAGSVVTVRPMLYAATAIIGNLGGYYAARPCEQVAFMINNNNRALRLYPDCAPYFTGENPTQTTVVAAKWRQGVTSGAEVHAALGLVFGMSVWLSLALHAIGVEIYLRLTPAEAERLRKISYQKQLEAGMLHPGRAGLTSDRLGDAEKWSPKLSDVSDASDSSVSTPDQPPMPVMT